MTGARTGFEVALEVHLPQFIGPGVFEALERRTVGAGLCIDEAIALEDAGNRAGAGNAFVAQIQQAAMQLACAPGWMLVAQFDDPGFDLGMGACRTVEWATRTIRQSVSAFFGHTIQQFVAGLAADAETLAQQADVGVFLTGQVRKLFSQ